MISHGTAVRLHRHFFCALRVYFRFWKHVFPGAVRRLPFLLLLFLSSVDAFAQSGQTDGRFDRERFYVEAATAAVQYRGDRPWRGASGLSGWSDRTGPGAALGVGYHVISSGDIVLSWAWGIFPGILSATPGTKTIDLTTSTSHRRVFSLDYRHRPLPFGSYEPFIGLGWGLIQGRINNDGRWGLGPVLSAGVYRPWGPVSVGLQLRHQFVMPDKAVDRAVSGGGADVLHYVLFGARYALPARTPRLDDVALSTPGFLETGEEGVFMVTADMDPADYSVQWDMSNGQSVPGQSIRHAFQRAGTYTITARVSTNRTTLSLESRVTVRDRIVPARIRTISHTPLSGFPGDTLRFEGGVDGTDVRCLWAFGDGASAADCTAEHVFETPGTYRVLLSATNAKGSDTMTRTIRIASDACAGMDQLADVHFRNSAQELVLDMREVLRDNFATAARCPERTLVVSGFAFDSERNAQELALDRARAVMQYYLNLGMSSRSVRLGRAVVQSEDGWIAELWEGRKVSTSLIRE